MTRSYQICTRCIMDTTDPEIEFDANGVCNHCRSFEELSQKILLPEPERSTALENIVREVKAAGAGKEYDCIIGVSGGVDSSYVAYMVKKLGLRPLAVHLDNGWNSELAVNNVAKFLKKLEIDLSTHVLNWEEFKDLQISFLKASVSDAEIPTDHAIGAVLYQAAIQYGLRYILLGTNFATEGILPMSWTYGVGDWRYIESVHHRYGQRPLRSYPHYTYWDMQRYSAVYRIQTISILNYLPYSREGSIETLEKELDWKYYGGKHYESIYTRFFQGYILPIKFGIDKRKAHLSTLILSGQLTRQAALAEMEKPPYPGTLQEEDREYVLKKLELSEEEFDEIMRLPVQTYRNFPNYLGVRDWIGRLRIGTIARSLHLLPPRKSAMT